MLSRIANNMFWMGRYLERTDHLARYINVEYFSSLDSPDPLFHTFALKSIIDMVGLPEPSVPEPNEEQILVSAALDHDNPVSILSSLYSARENARGVREHLSSELWDAINNYYHFVSNYPIEVYKTRGLFDFTTGVMQYFSNVRGRIMYSLLKDVSWQFIQMGMHIERSVQTARILISKLTDIERIEQLKIGGPVKAQQWNVLLDCLEAKDMCRRFYASVPDRNTTLDFLLFNPYFPKSVVNNLNELRASLNSIENKLMAERNSLAFKVGKVIGPLEYMGVEDIKDGTIQFLEETLKKIYTVSEMIETEYFS
ncbi:alpha-E domain-containing protein [Marinilongibacter aquaticus]|uniref:alpha-E domain-containing protein n=1 Tax=Marinilongibacter aquaticus TaxID=2975157 RepID=UPI0021BD71A8|nr:alpha-E domain-containing protein [Marinilongibacter aquaticus]UBM58159.1 alpha-E domain-containing protein [Marinilongibacter aquaticus]